MLTSALIIPPVPVPPPVDLPALRMIRLLPRNALLTWPKQVYEEEIRVRRVFGRTTFLLNAPDAIRHVLVEHPTRYGRTPGTRRIFWPMIGDGLLLSEGEVWKRQRRTLAPAFAPRSIPLLARHVVTAAEEVLTDLPTGADRPADLLTVFQHLALEIAGRSMFSLEMHRYGPQLRSLLLEYSRRLGRPHFLDIWLPLWLPAPLDPARRRFRRTLLLVLERLVAERQDAPSSAAPRDVFDLLTAARDPETGAALTAAELRDQVATLIFAGHETTALALFWSAYLLALAPAVQERVAAEAAAVALTPDTAADALPRLVVTQAVLHEALRLYPPAYAIARQAKQDDRIGALRVPAGSRMIVAPWVLHRHRKLWQAPDAFDPSRFLPEAAPVDRFAYLPFGVGSRVCIGAQFALTEATLVIAKLVQTFRLALASDRSVLPVATLLTHPDHAPPFRLTPRTTAGAAGRP